MTVSLVHTFDGPIWLHMVGAWQHWKCYQLHGTGWFM